jgi:hypothetical protein
LDMLDSIKATVKQVKRQVKSFGTR